MSDPPKSQSHSVTDWIQGVKLGSESAAAKIWERYVDELVREAERRLQSSKRRVSNGDDIAQEAFTCFFRGAREGRFSRLNDRDDLWQLLIVLADRRVKDFLRSEAALRRGGGGVRGDSALQFPDNDTPAEVPDFDSLCGPAVTPQTADELLWIIQQGFPELAEHQLQSIALDRAANFTDSEIAERHGISLRGVQRKLKLIRWVMTQAAEKDSAG